MFDGDVCDRADSSVRRGYARVELQGSIAREDGAEAGVERGIVLQQPHSRLHRVECGGDDDGGSHRICE
jgi:hypothetical protein